jgi:serine/threonine protein kinase
MLIQMRHPCLLEIVGYSLPTHSLPPRIGTKYAEKGSLKEALKQRQSGWIPPFMDETGIAIIVAGIVLGMRFIHRRCAIHRNLKPGNILLDDCGFVRIGDLGSSRLADMDVTMTKQAGTPMYMAPEMYEDGEYTGAVDVFSFALILYELLVGEPVFSPAQSPTALMKQARSHERPTLPDEMNVVVKRIIVRCWLVEPFARETFDDIWDALEKMKFRLTPNVDVRKVFEFVEWVRRNE